MTSSVIHPEVDWGRKYETSTHREMSTLRRDPRVNSTTTMHLSGDAGRLDRTGKPTAGQQTFFMGPYQKLVGGQLGWAYAEQTRGAQGMKKTMDPAEILAMFRQTAVQSTGSTAAAGGTGVASRSMTAPAGAARRSEQTSSDKQRKLVYWDGTNRHAVSPPPGHSMSALHDERRETWMPPEQSEAAASSKTSYSSTLKPSQSSSNDQAQTCRTLYGTSAAVLANQSLAGSIRTYGMVFKPIGHKDYEAVTRDMNGLGCWTKTQSDLTSSMVIGQPSRLMGPWEHTSTKLSLRRPS